MALFENRGPRFIMFFACFMHGLSSSSLHMYFLEVHIPFLLPPKCHEMVMTWGVIDDDRSGTCANK